MGLRFRVWSSGFEVTDLLRGGVCGGGDILGKTPSETLSLPCLLDSALPARGGVGEGGRERGGERERGREGERERKKERG